MTPLVTLFIALSIPSPSPNAPNRQPQLAAHGNRVALVYASANSIQFALSSDNGKTFTTPAALPNNETLAAGMHRGPRVAFTSSSGLIVSAILRGAHNQSSGHAHSSGNLVAWRSADSGKTWSAPVRINDVPDAAREGLHAMASNGNTVYAAWLDLRANGATKEPGMKLYGAISRDGGATWSANRLLYESPDGTICQCCHPSIDIAANGTVRVMFRNAMAGNRDMYFLESADGVNFGAATKIGEGAWKIQACPMDGGSIASNAKGEPIAIYRRESTVFLKVPGEPEKPLGSGKNPALAASKKGVYAIWQKAEALELWAPGATNPAPLAAQGAFPALLALANGSVVAAWEDKGTIEIKTLP